MAMAIICGYCGAVVSEGAVYCPVCGGKVDLGPLLNDALADADREVRPVLAEAYLALRRRNFQQAEAKCIEALRRFPNNASAHAMLAEVYEAEGRLDDAIEWLRMALDLDPDSQRLKRRLAKLRAKRGEGERSKEAQVRQPTTVWTEPPGARRKIWKAAGLVGLLVALLVGLTFLVGELTRWAVTTEERASSNVESPRIPPEVGGMGGEEAVTTSQPPPPVAQRREGGLPSLPTQRPVLPTPERHSSLQGPKGAMTAPEAKSEALREPISPPQAEEEDQPREAVKGKGVARPLPAPPPYVAGTDLRQYLLGYLRQVAAENQQVRGARWFPDWVEVDQNRFFVTAFAHIEETPDREELFRAAEECALTLAAAVMRVCPPTYWLSARVRMGHPRGPLLLVADFDRIGMMRALQEAGLPLEALAPSLWRNPAYFGGAGRPQGKVPSPR